MPLTVSETGGSDFKPIDAGVYYAVLYGLIDLGTQHNEFWNTYQHKCMLIWEIPSERIEIDGDDKPRVISKEYTLSLSEKAHLRHDLISWRGRDFTAKELIMFDISTIMGACCQLNIIHKETKKGKTYAMVSSIMPLRKDMKKFQSENPHIYFSFEDGGPIPEDCPEWIVKKIMQSQEYNESGQRMESHVGHENPPVEAYEDDIPF